MATERELNELLGRALTDTAFRARLLEDPSREARALGFDLTAEQLAGLRASDLTRASEVLDVRLSKMR